MRLTSIHPYGYLPSFSYLKKNPLVSFDQPRNKRTVFRASSYSRVGGKKKKKKKRFLKTDAPSVPLTILCAAHSPA